MRKNVKLYNASLHLYEAAKWLRDVDEKRKSHILDLSKKCLDEVSLTEESQEELKEIEEYAKMIKEKE